MRTISANLSKQLMLITKIGFVFGLFISPITAQADDSLVTNSPFLPADYGKVEAGPTPAPKPPVTSGQLSKEIELRGIFQIGGDQPRFSIFDKKENKGSLDDIEPSRRALHHHRLQTAKNATPNAELAFFNESKSAVRKPPNRMDKPQRDRQKMRKPLSIRTLAMGVAKNKNGLQQERWEIVSSWKSSKQQRPQQLLFDAWIHVS